jgi:hypothetical protein
MGCEARLRQNAALSGTCIVTSVQACVAASRQALVYSVMSFRSPNVGHTHLTSGKLVWSERCSEVTGYGGIEDYLNRISRAG